MVRFRDRNSETVFRMSADAVPAHFHAAVREARRAGVAVRKDSDADVVYYLNRTRLRVIGNGS